MGILVSLLLALVVAAAIGVAATWYLRRVRLPREEAAAGVAALSDMRWRDFIKLVLDVLAGRGFTRVSDPEAASDEGDIPLERDGELWLLSSRHGASYVLGSGDLAEFASGMRLRGAQGSGAIGDRFDGPAIGEQTRDVVPHVRVVVGNEHPCRRHLDNRGRLNRWRLQRASRRQPAQRRTTSRPRLRIVQKLAS